VLKDPHVLPNLWLIPLRDFIALAIWFASFWGNTVVWRGTRFRLRDGKLQPTK
jgi:ceramide glucosyltransferase